MGTDADDDFMAEVHDFESSLREYTAPTKLFGGLDVDDDDDLIPSLPYEIGRETVLIKEPENLCFGYVGTGKSKICIAGKECDVQTHKTAKATRPKCNHSLFILAPNSNGAPTCWATPYLNADKVNDDLKQHILTLEAKTTNLAGTFNLIKTGELSSLSELQGTKDLSRTVRKRVKEGRTPQKVQKRTRMEDLLARLLSLQNSLSESLASKTTMDKTNELLSIPDTNPKAVVLTATILNTHASSLETLGKRVSNTISSLRAFANFQNGEMDEILKISAGLQSSVDEMRGVIGKRSATEANLTDHSLWAEATSANARITSAEKHLKELGKSISVLVKAVKLVNIPANVMRQGSTVQSTPTSLHSNEEEKDVVMEEILSGTPGPRIKNGFLNPPSVRHGNQGAGFGGYAQGSDTNGIRVSGGGGGSGGGNGGFGGGHGPPGNYGGGGDGNAGGGDDPTDPIWSAVEELGKRLSSLEESSGGGGRKVVRLKQFVFRSPKDVGTLLETHLGVGAKIFFSCFMSPNIVLDQVFKYLSPGSVNAKDLKELRSLELRPQELAAYFSSDHMQTRPNLFSSTKRLSNHVYSSVASKVANARFTAIPSAEDYGIQGDGQGLHHALTTALKHVQTSALSDINANLIRAPILLALATQMLTISVTFVQELFAFMGQTYQSLKTSFDGEEEAWDCVCSSVQDLWECHFLPEKCDMASVDLNEPKNFATVIVWTNLRLTAVADGLSSAPLASHPTISSSYIRFLIEHLSSKKSSTMTEVYQQIKKLRADLEASNKVVAELKGKITGLESRHDKLSNQVNKKK